MKVGQIPAPLPSVLILMAQILAVPAKPLLCCWVSLGPSELCAVLTWWSKVQSDSSHGLVYTVRDFSLLSSLRYCARALIKGELGLKGGFGLYLHENLFIVSKSKT